jgi:hypothetical protein
MATIIKDLSQLKGIPELVPENVTALLVLLGQNGFVGEDVFNLVASADSFGWLKETFNDKFALARKIEEKGGPQNTEFGVEQKSDEAYEYFLSATITAKEARNKNTFYFVDLLTKKMDAIAGRIRMNTERDILAALQNKTLYTGIKSYSASTAWTTIATSDPYKDVAKAADKISASGYEADTLIIGRGDKTSLTLSDSIRDTVQYTSDYTQDGLLMEKLLGYDLYVSNARYKSGSSYIRLLSGTGILLAKGVSGELREAQAYLADTDYEKKNKQWVLLGSRAIKPIITYEETVGLIYDIS